VHYSEPEIRELSKRIGKSRSTLLRWAKEGCDLHSHSSVQDWIEKNRLRIHARRGPRNAQKLDSEPVLPVGNGDLPPAGRKGAAAALERLERQEEESHRRLAQAQASGNPSAIREAQEFWLRCSETLRRLDLAVETQRRSEETQISLKEAQRNVQAAAEWFRISFCRFLSSEGLGLMAIKDLGEWKVVAVDRFKGVLTLTLKNAEATNSAVAPWALEIVKDAWNTGE
jgi:transposase